ncbi:MAG TPA: hypothetical protein VGC13_30340 [Longimicrobium sp.]|jgi:hypothetical protein|uniref:hypothetical protein n=1 Tax=Longimicrobium sp. TaxID=2029185 RepID=UPI002EDB3BA3
MTSRAEKLVRWFMFSVLVSLVPLALTYFSHRLDRRVVHLEMLVARGELLLICTTLGAAALGELFPSGRDNVIPKLLAAGTSLLGVLVCSFYFAAIQSRAAPNAIVNASVSLFAGMLVASGSCLYYAHQEAR